MAALSLRRLSIAAACATLSAAGISNAQDGRRQNPNHDDNADGVVARAPADRASAEFEEAEREVPDSPLNASAAAARAQLSAAAVNAQVVASERDNPESGDYGMTRKRRSLLQRLHVANQAAIAAGRLAQANGGVRAANLGRKLVDDQTAADEKLMRLAKMRSVTLGDRPTDNLAQTDQDEDEQLFGALQQLHGAAFDRALAQSLEREHEKAIALIEDGRPSVREPGLAALLDGLVFTLGKQDAVARELRAEQMPQGSSAPGTAPDTAANRSR